MEKVSNVFSVAAGFHALLATSGVGTVSWHGKTSMSECRPQRCIVFDEHVILCQRQKSIRNFFLEVGA